MKRIIAPLLTLAYKMQHHFFFRISLRNWLWALVVIPPAAALVDRMSWGWAIALAVLGALLGAANGLSSIPTPWVENLVNSEQLLVRAGMLCRKPCLPADRKDLVEMELELTLHEQRLREQRGT